MRGWLQVWPRQTVGMGSDLVPGSRHSPVFGWQVSEARGPFLLYLEERLESDWRASGLTAGASSTRDDGNGEELAELKSYDFGFS